MYRFKVTLKSGKEITWDSSAKDIEEVSAELFEKEQPRGLTILPDGRIIGINADEIAAEEAIPLKQCWNCKADVVPEKETLKVSDYGAYGQQAVFSCPECGAGM